MLCSPAIARADEYEDFENARRPYEEGDYQEAVNQLERLVPRLTDAIILQEARKYLGAAYLFVDREADAVREFEQIVEADEDQRIQTPTFSSQVVAIFDRVRRRVRDELEAERETERRAEEERRQAEIRLLMENREALQQLRDLASVSEVHEPNSRLMATIPFGVGQFQNEKVGLGAFFLVSEVAFGAGAIITYIAWATLGVPASRQEQILRISNQALFSLFGATLIAGLIEAHVNFRPERVIRQRREIPAELLPREPAPRLDVSVSPFGASLRVTF